MEIWAHSTSNSSTWRVTDIYAGNAGSSPGNWMSLLVGDTIYFDATSATTATELWAHNTSNSTTWLVKDINTASSSAGSDPGRYMEILVGDTLYFGAYTPTTKWELWAHDTSNHSTWRITDMASTHNLGANMHVLAGDTIYFEANDGLSGAELWAYDTSNGTTWLAKDLNPGSGGNSLGYMFEIVVGDTIFFDKTQDRIYAHDTSTGITRLVANINTESACYPGYQMLVLVENTIYFDAVGSSSDTELWAYAIDGVNLMTNTGGDVTSYELNSSLPNGLSFDTNTGIISGSPTGIVSQTAYKVWANNSGGSVEAYLNITVNDASPGSFTYNPIDMDLTINQVMVPNTVSPGGGAVTSWEISPDVPNGLNFESSNGTIWGTPTVLQTSPITYTIWANNSGGSASTTVTITIIDQVASISYPSTVEVSNDRAMTTVTPTNTGGAVTSWEISPSLPSNLNFGSSNGSIWGTPTGLLENTTYTVYANNSGGSTSTTFTLGLNWTLTPSAEGAFITRNSSIASDITWEWDYDPLEAQNLSLVTGEWNTCALDSNQNVFCWGRNGNGQIGNGQTGTAACGTSGHKCKDIPTATNDLGSDVISLAFGHQHACGLLDTGAVKCWGRNNAGQLGTSGGDKDTPQTINLGSGRTATSIYAGGHYTCAILDDTSVKCWGQNTDGQLGIGSNLNTNTPTTINTLGSGRTAVSLATAMSTVCALLDDGSVKCWGDDAYGQLGNGGTNTDTNSPSSSAINLGSGRTAKAITGGEFHFCAILDDDSIKCWGHGANGKLGTGSHADRTTPTSTSGSFATGRYAVAIDAGYDHTCAILDNGQLTCWGSDSDGQLGNGATTGTKSSLQSSTVSLGTGRTAISISAGGTHTCAQLDNNELMCWGNRADGQVGDNGNFNNPSDRTSPSSVSNNNHGGNTYLNTGVMPSSAVTGATCEISPSLPTGLSLTAGTCAITGTPTVTATNATYTVWANVSGQSFSGQIWLEVGLNAPDISYSSSTYTYTKDIEIFTLNPTNIGGEVITWVINATLPSGLTFEPSNGTIWGTPDTITTATTYTIWANNSAGSSSTTVTITINDAVPGSFTYNPIDMDLTINQVMVPNTVSPGGGAVTSWEISPDVPNGLNFESSNGTIWGTPTVLQTSPITYTIWANNSGGSSSTTVTITINDTAPIVTYSPNDEIIFTKGVTLSPDVGPSSTGGFVTSWEISPSQNPYFHWNSVNGYIGGTPTNLLPRTQFTIWANNSGGSVVTYVNITINDAVPSISYNPDWFELTKDVAMSPTATPANVGGAIPSTVIDSTGNVGEYSSIAIDSYGYKHISYYDAITLDLKYATDKTGSWVTISVDTTGDAGQYSSIAIDSNDAVHISYYDSTHADLKYATCSSGCTITSNWNVVSVDTAVNVGSWNSIAIDSNDAVHISYYDSTYDDLKYATCSSGCTSASNWNDVSVDSIHAGNVGSWNSIAIDSNDAVHISYRDSTNNNLKYTTCSSGCTIASNWNDVTVDTGNVGHYTSIAIDSNDAVHISYYDLANKDLKYASCSSGCTIASNWNDVSVDTAGYVGSHTSIAIDSNDAVHISYRESTNDDLKYATCSSGCTTASNWNDVAVDTDNVGHWNSIAIDSNDAVHISYFDLDNDDLKYVVLDSSSNILGYSVSPALPAGLSLNIATGEISGTPTVISANTTYTITASNSGGTATTTVTIVVNDEIPSFYYSPPEFNFTKGVTISSTILPINTGGTPTSYTISPNLLSIFHFGINNGMIGGTPSITLTRTQFMITATNSGGSSVTYINVTINDAVPTLSYPSSPYTIVRGYDMTDITPTTSGIVSTWEISPSLPSGLSFNNGVITGKPFANQSTVTYTVYANNSGGSGSATFDLTINEPTPNIDYNPDNYTLSNNSAIRIDPILQANPPSAVAAITYSGTAAPQMCLMQMGDLIFYMGTDPTHGRELWAFNHTLPVSVNNPYMVKDVYSGADDGISGGCDEMLVVNNTLFFSGDDGSHGEELWKSDGTLSGTSMVKDISGGDSNPRRFMSAGDKLFFSAGNWPYSRWVSDGTNVGTYQVGLISTNVNSYFKPQVEYNGSIYGQGWDGHRVLFSLNETAYERVADIGGGHNNPRALTIYDGWLYFLTYTSAAGTGCLYRTNGTEAGTSMFVCDTPPYSGISNSKMEMAVFNDELYFIRDSSGHGDELWKTDGTQSGTVMVKDIVPGSTSGFCPTSSCPGGMRFHATENYLLFDVDSDGDGQLELWKTDGTSGGTSLLKEILLPGAVQIYYHQVDEIVYFRASQHGSSDYELWSTDGTPAGTVRVEDIREGLSGSSPRDIIDVDGTLYFIAYNGSSNSLFNVNNAANGIIGAPTTWSISPSTLPSGLTFNNGVISGTPTVLQLTPVMYTITASNANGSSSTTINLTIIDAVPGTFAYNPVDMELTLNQAMTPNTVSPGGGAVITWEISPDLPAGLNFESSNGTIWGTPTILQIDPVMYTIWANNSGGSVEVNVNITINDEAPDIEYNPDWFVVDKGVWLPGGQLNPPLSAIPTNSGGDIPGEYIHTSSMSPTPGQYNSIAIDSNGFRHVAYYSGYTTGYTLTYATDMSGTWTREVVDSSALYIGQHTSIAIDSNDKVHISYFDDTNTDLKYATNAGGAWATVSVDTSSVGKYTSIAIDSNDIVHISYYDTSFRNLKYATCSAVCSQASSWTTLTIDSTGIVGHTSSIAIDSSDTIHISYRASILGNIKYATCSSSCSTISSWTTTTIDNSGEATDPSIVVDSNDDVHIAYRIYNSTPY
ncbi:MAG: putative Ig domain-containing protein [Candidatus Poseidoniaceae archaeon]